MDPAPIKNGSFTYSPPTGLLNSGIPRADKKALRQHLHPVRPLRAAGGEWAPPRITGRWCKAQLAHYGVRPLMGSRAEVEARLRAAHAAGRLAKQPPEVRVMEKYMRREWRAGCAAAAAGGVVGGGGAVGEGGVKREGGVGVKDEGGGGVGVGVGVAPGGVEVKREERRRGAGAAAAFSKKHVLGTWDVSCPAMQAGGGGDGDGAAAGGLTILLFQDIESSSVVGEIIFGAAMEGVLRLRTNPSARNPRVGFDWAGVVAAAAAAGEGEGELGAQAERGSGSGSGRERGREREGEIRFYSRGERAHGRFQCIDGVGRGVEFEAVKVREMPIRGKVDFSSYAAAPAGSGPDQVHGGAKGN
ncbi:hypothetical protein DFP73DRAFT_629113 [Morchella snyderi]|nr:hypothetical protein DFP73DRAFT_629113 [Morchella snyderi]